jgi:glutamine cyclotransferase
LATGDVLQMRRLPAEYFGEGITVYDDTIVQLTWQSQTGFVYNKDSFNLLRQFSYPTEGWGITYDGERLIMSDGTCLLHLLNPKALESIGDIEVRDDNKPVSRLNELEYVNGKLYANVWKTDRIAIIEPQDGRVTGWIDLSGLLRTQNYSSPVDVLNGIAYDSQSDRLFVTGKLWPFLFEIKLVAEE